MKVKLNGRIVNLRLSEKGERICDLWCRQEAKTLTPEEAIELKKLELDLSGEDKNQNPHPSKERLDGAPGSS
jgi:hypothetical protein